MSESDYRKRGRQIHETKPTTKTLYRVREIDVEHGEAVLYRVEKDGNRAFNGYDSYFLMHAVEETRYTHNMKPLSADTNVRYHAWSVENGSAEDVESDPLPYMVEKEDIPAPNIDSAAQKYLNMYWG